MREFLIALFIGVAWLGAGLLVHDHLKLRERVSYIDMRAQTERVKDADSPNVDWLARFFSALATITAVFLFLETRDKARRELRAYLGIGGGEIFFLPGEKIRGVVEVRNFGKTPAHNVRVAVTGQLREPRDQSPFDDPQTIPHVQPVAPTMAWTVGHEFLEMGKKELADVLADKKYVYIWGYALYEDVYGASHTLRFRFRNVVKVFGPGREEGTLVMHKWKYYPDADGNYAD